LMTNLQTIPEFILKFFLPLNLSPMAGFGWIQTLSGIILIILLIGLSWKYLSGSIRWVYFGFLWFLLFTVPGMLYKHPLGQAAYDYLEHRAYLPMMGIVIILYFFFLKMENHQMKRRLYRYLILAITVYGLYGYIYTGNYANPLVFYDRVIETNPGSAMAFYNKGQVTAFHEKDYPRALEDFNQALKIRPDYSKALVNRGICKEFLGDTAGALKDCERGAELEPGLFIAHKNIAIMKNQIGHKTEAVKAWDIALRISPDYYQGFNERGLIKYQLQEYPSAEIDFNRCLQINKSYPEAYLNRGLLFKMMNEQDKACNDWKSAAALGSDVASRLVSEYCGK
jgi:tetratricopeptide (TPR) repeat protein